MTSKTGPLSFFFSAMILAWAALAHGAEPETRQHFPLWAEGAPFQKGETEKDVPTLTVYPAPKENSTGAAVVVCPGGGYAGLASHEGKDVAEWFASIGITGFVLRYRHSPGYGQPVPLLDAARAIRTVRTRCEEWSVDPNRIGIIGFSAGGHLASTAGTHFDAGDPAASDPIDRASSRPDAMILVYPVITMGEFTHQGSKRNLLGKNPSQELVDSYSNEKRITENTPPAFLVHSVADKAVPCQNSIDFVEALLEKGIDTEFHLYQEGRHGFGLALADPVLSSWPRRLEAWLRLHGF